MRSIAVALFFLVAGNAFAQRENISIGPMIGGSYATLANFKKVAPNLNPGYKLGFSGGVFVNYSIREHFGLTANVLYTRAGVKLDGSPNINLDYIQVPVLATYYFGNDLGKGAIRPKVFIGPSVNFQIGNNALNNDAFKTVDIGATVGAGLNIGLPKQHWINIDARFNRGFSKVYKADTPVELKDVRNQSFSLLVGYSIPLGRYDKKNNSFHRAGK